MPHPAATPASTDFRGSSRNTSGTRQTVMPEYKFQTENAPNKNTKVCIQVGMSLKHLGFGIRATS